jgi:hypothetical protein
MMVAATDFNLGDWVYLKSGSGVAPVQVDAGIVDRLRQPSAPADEIFEPIPLTLQLLESADFHFVRTPDGAMKHGTIDTAMIRHSITEEAITFHFWMPFPIPIAHFTTCTNCNRFSATLSTTNCMCISKKS